jgi:chromosome segregation ATPase
MAGKTNTERIEALEDKVTRLLTRLKLNDLQIEGISESLKKSTEAAERHTSTITVIEQKLLVLVDTKQFLADVGAIRLELVALKKDLESLGKWKDELKKEREETARRLWAFGPNLLAAIISGLISLGVALLVVWLNKLK